MYSPTFWDHVRHPRNKLALPDAHVGEGRYQRCGDRLTLYLEVDDNCIKRATFQARACAPVVAVASLGTEMIQGLDIETARRLSIFDMDKELGGLPPSKRHAYLLFLQCLHEALEIKY
jgi:nitrogen fixation protein NifU and related proteins